jgi:hypothetical protein
VDLFKNIFYNILVEDLTSAVLNGNPTASNALTNQDSWNPGDSRIAFTYGPERKAKGSKKKKKKKSKEKKVKVIPFTRPSMSGMSGPSKKANFGAV